RGRGGPDRILGRPDPRRPGPVPQALDHVQLRRRPLRGGPPASGPVRPGGPGADARGRAAPAVPGRRPPPGRGRGLRLGPPPLSRPRGEVSTPLLRHRPSTTSTSSILVRCTPPRRSTSEDAVALVELGVRQRRGVAERGQAV